MTDNPQTPDLIIARRTIVVGLTVATMGYASFAIAWEGWMIYALIPITALGLLTNPALQGILSKATPDDAQGEMQGVLTGIGAIASIISPLMMTAVFGYFTRAGTTIYAPGAPFYLAAALDSVALLIFLWAMRRRT